MNNLVCIYMTIFIVLIFLLMVFAVFAIGFLIGYKREDSKILRKSVQTEIKDIKESDREKKNKKDWKRFLEYDGSVPVGRE